MALDDLGLQKQENDRPGGPAKDPPAVHFVSASLPQAGLAAALLQHEAGSNEVRESFQSFLILRLKNAHQVI